RLQVLNHHPFRSLMLEIDLDAGGRSVALHVENHTLAEFAVTNTPAQAHAGHSRLLGPHPSNGHWTRNLDPRADLLDKLFRDLLDESRWHSVAVSTVESPLLRVGQEKLFHRACHTD